MLDTIESIELQIRLLESRKQRMLKQKGGTKYQLTKAKQKLPAWKRVLIGMIF